MMILKAVGIGMVIIAAFFLGMQAERYLSESEDQLRQAVFSEDGLPGTDLYTLPEENSRTGIVVDQNKGQVYYCRIDLFGNLVKKEFLFEIDHYTDFKPRL